MNRCTEIYQKRGNRSAAAAAAVSKTSVYYIHTLLLTLVFYGCSITLTFYNNHCIKMFPYPLSITFLHLYIKFILAWIWREWYSWYYHRNRTQLSWNSYVKTVAASGISSGLDIGFSNWSFEFITISMYTMTKSTSIIFTLLFSILFHLERKRPSLILVVLLISCGLFLFSYESTQFDGTGVLLVLVASFLSGIRWTTVQVLTQQKEWGLSNPVDLIYHAQPWMALVVLPLSVYIESSELIASKNLFRAEDVSRLISDFAYLCIGGLLAFALECSEYMVVSTASGLTLTIAGIFKEVCTLYLATTYNGDEISPINFLGFLTVLFGIGLHVFLKTVHHQPIIKPRAVS